MSQPIGIKAVAAAAGVSLTTVSHALNGKGRISEATRLHVQEVAERLGYRPSAMARALAGGRTGMLAIIVSRPAGIAFKVGDSDYFLDLMNGATSAALGRGYSLTMLQPDRDPAVLEGFPLDGAIVIDPVASDPVVQRLHERGIPVVTTGRVLDGPVDACWVDNDHARATRAVLQHMADAGSRRIALLAPPPVTSYVHDIGDAYVAWCEQHGQEPVIARVNSTTSEGSAYTAAMELLLSSEPPDGIYTTLDRLARGVLLAAEAAEIHVPDDLRIAGLSDSELNRQSRPALTAQDIHPAGLGREAVDLLLAVVEEGGSTTPHRLLPATLVPRASTAAAGSRHDAIEVAVT